MSKDASFAPKGTITFSKVGSDFSTSNISAGFASTYKLKKGKLLAGVTLSDRTFTPVAFNDVKKMKDVVVTGDYKLTSAITANTKYELGTKKYTAGATWGGKLVGKPTTLKLWYSNKDNLATGEAVLAVTKNQKATLGLNQKKLLNAKYAISKGSFLVEPSYNFPRKAPAVAVTKKFSRGIDSLKLAYDIKGEAAAVEVVRKPLKMVIGTTVSNKLKFGKPTISAILENTYTF